MSDVTGSEYLDIAKIVVGDSRRPIDPSKVASLAESIKKIGLQHPVTVRKVGDQHQLVAGFHRLEACKSLERGGIDCTVVNMTDVEARLWEIAENLHRADLSVIQQAEQLTEWVKLSDKKKRISAQVGRKSKPKAGRPESGTSAASRELGIPWEKVRRSQAIAGIGPEAKKAAHAAGLENNQSRLLEVAKAEAHEQVAKVRQVSQELNQKKQQRRPPAPGKGNPAKRSPSKALIWASVRDAINNIKDLPPASECIEIIRAKDKQGLVDQLPSPLTIGSGIWLGTIPAARIKPKEMQTMHRTRHEIRVMESSSTTLELESRLAEEGFRTKA
jgi:ParB-like chromosome segregation protein Spo0J